MAKVNSISQTLYPLVMEIQPECAPCLMKRMLFQAKLANNGTEFKALSATLRTFADEFGKGKNSAVVATDVHRTSYAAMGVKDPYLALKMRSDEVAAEHTDAAEGFVNNSKDRFRAAVLMSVVGNVMDFGSGIAIDHPDDFRKEFKKLVDQGIGSDDTDRMLEMLRKTKNVIYVFDNCGESQFDKILIKEIQSMGIRVVGVVRGEPILNDVTMDDAERIGLTKILDRTLTTSQFAIGMDLEKISDELKEEISGAGLMIAKGMANYESLSDQDTGVPVVHILRSKCTPVARSLGVDTGINVVRLIEH